MVARGVKLGLGTDGAASNNTLDLLRDAQIASLLHKGVAGDPTVLPARTIVELATVGGARVLGLHDRIGTLREGMEADLVCLETARPHATPIYDPFSYLVFSARAADVRNVLVRGRVLVRDWQALTVDEERVRAQATEFAAHIRG
jgi:5-methylthioadenosine/S-adenosylhomocysteine deaminase